MQATADPLYDELLALVETLRATGFHGSDTSLAAADAVVGTGIVALRQLEAVAVQLASIWLDGDAADLALARSAFLPRMTALARIADDSFGTQHDGGSELPGALEAMRVLIDRAQTSADTELPAAIAPLLAGAMILRQSLEREALASGASAGFQAASSNVAPSFFARCIQRLPKPPFGAAEGVPLMELVSRLAQQSRSGSSSSSATARPERRTA